MVWSKQFGNMYPWVDFMHCHLGGRCGHDCTYCYVGKGRWGRAPRYEGEIRLIEEEFRQNYYKEGVGKVIFMEHKNDIAGPGVTPEMQSRIFAHAAMYPENLYVFQTKNPEELYANGKFMALRRNAMFGTTIETDDQHVLGAFSKAPEPLERFTGISNFAEHWNTFITVEPIMKMHDPIQFGRDIVEVNPLFVNIGADSKRSGLPEPSWEDVEALINIITDAGVEIREKTNLERLKAGK